MMKTMLTTQQVQELMDEAEGALKDSKNNPPQDIPDTF